VGDAQIVVDVPMVGPSMCALGYEAGRLVIALNAAMHDRALAHALRHVERGFGRVQLCRLDCDAA